MFRQLRERPALRGFDRGGLDDLGELDHLVLAGPLELRLELVEPLVGLGEVRLGVAEVLADEVEVVLEPLEVLAEVATYAITSCACCSICMPRRPSTITWR